MKAKVKGDVVDPAFLTREQANLVMHKSERAVYRSPSGRLCRVVAPLAGERNANGVVELKYLDRGLQPLDELLQVSAKTFARFVSVKTA